MVGPQNGVTVDQGGRYIISSISSTHILDIYIEISLENMKYCSLLFFLQETGKKPGGSQHIAPFYPKILPWRVVNVIIFSSLRNWQESWWFTAYCTILPWRVVNVIPLWGAVSAIRLRESFLTTGIWRVSDGNQWFFF